MRTQDIYLAVVVAGVVALAGASGRAASAGARQWRIVERTFRASGARAKGVSDAALSATFTGPGGRRYVVGGFWDGEGTWKVRFAPPAPGRWTCRTTCSDANDAGLGGRSERFDVAPADGDNALYRHGGFLKVSENHRYLTHTDGAPFFWLGDTWWFCPSNLVPIDTSSWPGTKSTYRLLVETRKAQGFTVAHMAFLGGPWRKIASGAVDLAYWRKVDRYFATANDAGIVPVFGLGFHQQLNDVSLAELKRIWTYVLARLGSYACTFLVCGEYNQAGAKDAQGRVTFGPADAARVKKLLALGAFIKRIDPYQRAMTVHPWWYRGEKRQVWNEGWYDFIMLQGGHGRWGPAAKFYLDIRGREPARPLLEGECTYEGIHGYDAGVVRHHAYRAIQCGSFGYTYGSHGLWYPNQNARDKKFSEWGPPVPWWVALKRPGGAQMKHLRACYESVRWWCLAPRPGAVETARSLGEHQRILAQSDGEGLYLLYYPAKLPAGTEARLRARPGGGFEATWFNPRDGKTTPAGKAVRPGAAGKVPLPVPPDRNDWLLILRRPARRT